MSVMLLICSILLFNLPETLSQRWPLSGTCHPCRCEIKQQNFGRVKHVNCSGLGLTRIPRNLPTDLHTLDFSQNQILPQELQHLCTFTSMQYIYMMFNQLEFIPTQTFRQCHDLLQLNLTGNKITILEEDTFLGLGNLQQLHGMEVDELMDHSFRQLTKLTTLDLTFNGDSISEKIFDNLSIQELKLTLPILRNLPFKIFSSCFKTLKEVSIIGPKITFLSEDMFQGLTVLRKIYLDLESLETLSEKIFRGSDQMDLSVKPQNLQEIWILNVGSIPDVIFQDLENIQKLVLQGISTIPNSEIFKDLFNLEYLELNDCHVNQIPNNWFQQLYSLKILKLRQTGIRSLEPGVLDGLLKLEELDLSYNVLRKVEAESLKPLASSIKKINFRANMFKTIDDHLFQKMYNLLELDISDNKLESIHQNAFTDLRHLITLDIRDNKLSNLPDSLFQNVNNLQTLNLASNTLNQFPDTLNNVGYLLRLDVSNNRIQRLPANFLHSFPYLEYLNVDNNPLYCDCDSIEIRFFQPNLKIIGTCLSPQKFAWRRFSEIKISECREEISSSDKTDSSTSLEPSIFSSSLIITSLPYIVPSSPVYTTVFQDLSTSLMYTTPSYVSSDMSLSSFYTSEAVEYSSTILNTQATTTSHEPFISTIFYPTPPLLSYNVTSDLNITVHPPIYITSTIYTTPSTSSDFPPPVVKEGTDTDSFLDSMVFRITIGVVSGALFLCGMVAIILWRKRVERRKRYEVTTTSMVV